MAQRRPLLAIVILAAWIPAVHAASRAREIQSSLDRLTRDPRLQEAQGAANLSACNIPPLDLSDDIDARLEWASAVESCLKIALAGLQTSVALDQPANRVNALVVLNSTNELHRIVGDYKETLLGEKDFIGVKWGIGVGFSHGFDDIVDEAEVVDGVVRVTKDLTSQPRVILEFHGYRWCHSERVGDEPIKTGCGPFAAVASRDDKVVSGVAAGWMYGWKTGRGEESQGFSVGGGVILDANGKELGEGFTEGQPPPAGASDVFLEEKSVLSAVLFFTRTF